MKVVVIGSGAREHALSTALSSGAEVSVRPGNAGIPRSLPLVEEDITSQTADLVVIGPEAPLIDGMADRLRARGVRVFGPGADGAQLEGSKAWMKDLFAEIGIPTARSGTFTEVAPALEFAGSFADGCVVKTDGLAAGKGVAVLDSPGEAESHVRRYLSGEAFGDAGRRIVIEERLTGPELSVFAVCDGERVVPCGSARDHKRVGNGDTGPNTGGMGAFSPVPGTGAELVDQIMDEAIEPTVWGLRKRGIDYRGFLYCGLMLTPEGPRVLEYNVRFGDPEAQVLMPMVKSDLADLLAAAADGALRSVPSFDPGAAVTVVCAAAGYPESPRKGEVVHGFPAGKPGEGATVFAAGVANDAEGRLVTAGGRVLSVTGQGEDLPSARERAYRAVAGVSFEGMHYRTDIAQTDNGGAIT